MTLNVSTWNRPWRAALAVMLGLAHAQAHGQPAGDAPAAASAVPARANLNITPKRLVLDRGKRTASIYVFNQGNVPVTADVSLVDRVMLPDGQIKAVGDAPAASDIAQAAERLNSARAYVMAAPRRITLMPGRGQTIRLRALLPADEQAPEYRSHLTVVTVPPRSAGLTAEDVAAQRAGQLSIQINAVFGLSIPVIIRNGTADARAEISGVELTHERDPARGAGSSADVPSIEFDIVRKGASSLYGTALVQVGTEVLGIARGVGVYPEIDSRRVKLRLQRAPAPGELLDIRFVDDDVAPDSLLARQSFPVR